MVSQGPSNERKIFETCQSPAHRGRACPARTNSGSRFSGFSTQSGTGPDLFYAGHPDTNSASTRSAGFNLVRARQSRWDSPNQAAIRDIEQGKDVKLSSLQSVAAVLGLKLELTEQVA